MRKDVFKICILNELGLLDHLKKNAKNKRKQKAKIILKKSQKCSKFFKVLNIDRFLLLTILIVRLGV